MYKVGFEVKKKYYKIVTTKYKFEFIQFFYTKIYKISLESLINNFNIIFFFYFWYEKIYIIYFEKKLLKIVFKGIFVFLYS